MNRESNYSRGATHCADREPTEADEAQQSSPGWDREQLRLR
ncbi:hypothetical protein [Streptomyces atratus]|nr:hypothetical protein OG936_38225 [Streptomyces sp. NBC_00846]